MLLLLPLLAAAQPAPDGVYRGSGSEPFWHVEISGDRITFGSSTHEGEMEWRGARARTVRGIRSWRAGEGSRAIAVEARPELCDTEAEETYADHVTVRYEDYVFTGCGGQLISREYD